MTLSAAQLVTLCARPSLWADPLNRAMGDYLINTVPRQAMFLATCAHESGMFATLEENLNYSAAGLLKTWPTRFSEADAAEFAHHPQAIANRVYANRAGNFEEGSGDGWNFRGRGPIQITGRDNYQRCADSIGLDCVANPDLLTQPVAASLSAAWFWWKAGCNEVADAGDFVAVSGIINRGDRALPASNMEDRLSWLRKAQSALA